MAHKIGYDDDFTCKGGRQDDDKTKNDTSFSRRPPAQSGASSTLTPDEERMQMG